MWVSLKLYVERFPFLCLFAEFTIGFVIRNIKVRNQIVMGWKKIEGIEI